MRLLALLCATPERHGFARRGTGRCDNCDGVLFCIMLGCVFFCINTRHEGTRYWGYRNRDGGFNLKQRGIGFGIGHLGYANRLHTYAAMLYLGSNQVFCRAKFLLPRSLS